MRIILIFSAVSCLLLSSGYAQDTVHVQAGWNMIGSVKAGAVPDVLSTLPDSLISSSFWGYAPGIGYKSTDTLDDGFGYWIKVKADGIIIFNTAPVIDSCKSKAFIYQGKLYNTVKIGEQCWMAENLDVGAMIAGGTTMTNDGSLEKYCFNDDTRRCKLYGGLYQWNEAMQYNPISGSQGICPSGWHIPTSEEYLTLSAFVDGNGNALKVVGEGVDEGAGTNTSGFSAVFIGFWYEENGFVGPGTGAFWCSNPGAPTHAFGAWLYDPDSLFDQSTVPRTTGFSVRCIED